MGLHRRPRSTGRGGREEKGSGGGQWGETATDQRHGLICTISHYLYLADLTWPGFFFRAWKRMQGRIADAPQLNSHRLPIRKFSPPSRPVFSGSAIHVPDPIWAGEIPFSRSVWEQGFRGPTRAFLSDARTFCPLQAFSIGPRRPPLQFPNPPPHGRHRRSKKVDTRGRLSPHPSFEHSELCSNAA